MSLIPNLIEMKKLKNEPFFQKEIVEIHKVWLIELKIEIENLIVKMQPAFKNFPDFKEAVKSFNELEENDYSSYNYTMHGAISFELNRLQNESDMFLSQMSRYINNNK